MKRRPKKFEHWSRWPSVPTTAPSPNAGGPFYKRAFPITTKELKSIMPKRQKWLF